MVPTNTRMQSNPMNVMPSWRCRIDRFISSPPSIDPLLNRIPHPPPERPVTSIEIKPDSHRLADQILLRHEPRRIDIVQPPAVLAVVAVVAHEEIVARGHHPLAGFDAAVGEHDAMAFGVQLLEGRGSAHIVPQILLGTGIGRPALLEHGLAVD